MRLHTVTTAAGHGTPRTAAGCGTPKAVRAGAATLILGCRLIEQRKATSLQRGKMEAHWTARFLKGEVTSEPSPQCLQFKVLSVNLLPVGERCLFLTDLYLPLTQSARLALLLIALILPSFHTNTMCRHSQFTGVPYLPQKSTPSHFPWDTGLLDGLWLFPF